MSIKRNLWKVGIAIAGILLLLVFMMWLSVPAAGAQGGVLGSATPGTATVQATPTVDATVTALNKEKLMQEIDQLKNQNYWAWTAIGSIGGIATFLLALVGFTTAILGFRQWLGNRRDEQVKRAEEQKRWLDDRQAERDRRREEQQRWLEDRKDEREKRAEERFQATVIGLGDEKEEAKINAAILLRTFLRPDHEQFYTQTFDLAVAHLRLPRNPHLPPTLSQALIVAFKESFPLARDRLKAGNSQFNPQSLDASGTRLDNANLNFADLELAWMPGAFLREANLFKANLIGANLAGADLSRANLIESKLNSNGTSLNGAKLIGANLNKADLSQAYLIGTNLSHANLSHANLSKAGLPGANLEEADLRGANLSQVDLTQANLSKANLLGADLSESHLNGTDLSNADLSYANLSKVFLADANLSGADLSSARLLDTATSLERADLRGVKGLTDEQLKAYEARGAIIDKDSTAIPSQSTITLPQSGPDNNAQALLVPPAQGSVPTLDASESSATSSKSSSEP